MANDSDGSKKEAGAAQPLPDVKCPVCQKQGPWFSGAYGPFCSHRCKLIDLGKWLKEEHAISEPLRPDQLEEYANLPPGEHLDRPETESEK